jgi:hypothetical protein
LENIFSKGKLVMKYLLALCGVIIGVITLFAVEHMGFSKKPAIDQSMINPSHAFNLTADELKKFTLAAQSGDCHAAYRLALYHGFFIFDYDQEIIWLRIAAKCDDVEVKAMLIDNLLAPDNDASVAAEIDKLAGEIQALDPVRGEKMLTTIQKARKKAADNRK